MREGDVPVDVHSAEDYEESEEYVVDSIVAQKGRGKNLQYMVKWKVSFCFALDFWSYPPCSSIYWARPACMVIIHIANSGSKPILCNSFSSSDTSPVILHSVELSVLSVCEHGMPHLACP